MFLLCMYFNGIFVVFFYLQDTGTCMVLGCVIRGGAVRVFFRSVSSVGHLFVKVLLGILGYGGSRGEPKISYSKVRKLAANRHGWWSPGLKTRYMDLLGPM